VREPVRTLAFALQKPSQFLSLEVPRMSRRLPFLFVATTLLSLAGCASSQSNARTEASAQAQGGESAQPICAMCPMKVEGTQAAASDVEGGVALTFTTATGDVEALRAQVARMAERHNAHHAGASSPDAPAQGCCQQAGQGPHGPGHHGRHPAMGKAMGMPMMAAKASVEEVPGGARMVLTPNDPANLGTLRQHVHQHAGMMSKGGCSCPAMKAAGRPPSQGS
jgi:hypothetical protein